MPKKASPKKKIVKKSSAKTKSKKVEKKEISKPQKLEVKGKFIGVVSNYFEHIDVAAIKLASELKVGDKIRIVGGEVDFEQKIESMQIQHEVVQKAKKGNEIGIKIKEKVRKGYKIFRV